LCTYILAYGAENRYPPKRGDIGCTRAEEEALAKNGVIEFRPLYEGGPPVAIRLTEKGLRMAKGRTRSGRR
jgi:hypothetical protein